MLKYAYSRKYIILKLVKIFRTFIKKENRKIELNELNNIEYIEYKNSVYNRRIAICSIFGVVLTIITLLYTIIENNVTENHIKKMLENADTLTSATLKASEFAEKSAISAEKALKQSESQFLSYNQSSIIFEDAKLYDKDISPHIDIQLKIIGEKDIGVKSINYSIKYLSRKHIYKSVKALNLRPSFSTSIESIEYKDSGKLEEGVKFYFKENQPSDSLKFNSVGMGYLLYVEIKYLNLITNIDYKYLLAIYCDYSYDKLNPKSEDKFKVIFQK